MYHMIALANVKGFAHSDKLMLRIMIESAVLAFSFTCFNFLDQIVPINRF